MSQPSEVRLAVNKLLDFTEFFLSLGDMKQTEMLIAIAERDPGFADYFETADVHIETAVDFFKVYAEWAVERIRRENNPAWDAVKEARSCSEKFQNLKIQCAETTVLWDVLEKTINHERTYL